MASTAHVSTLTKNSLNSWCSTKSELFKVNHVWTIHNFSFCQEDMGEQLLSPIFAAANGSHWRLVLYTKGISQGNRDYVSLCLELCSSKKYGIESREEVNYRLSLRKATTDKPWPAAFNFFYKKFKIPEKSGYTNLIKRDDLFEASNGLLVDDKLTILCEIVIRGNTLSSSNAVSVHDQLLPNHECRLADDLGSIFNKFGDVTIEADGKEFLVYRAILQARSPVFAAMFEHEMEERVQNRVVITDVKHDVLEEMLTYIYTGRSLNLKDMAEDLLAIADKYDLKGLKIMSEKVLCAKLSEENAVDILMLAELHSADLLRKSAINFIAVNSSHFLGTPVWEKTVLVLSKHPNLVVEVTRALFSFTK